MPVLIHNFELYCYNFGNRLLSTLRVRSLQVARSNLSKSRYFHVFKGLYILNYLSHNTALIIFCPNIQGVIF